jgi:hypothetical protein
VGFGHLKDGKFLSLLFRVSCKKMGEIPKAVFLGNLKSLVIVEKQNSSKVCKQQNSINGICARNGIA